MITHITKRLKSQSGMSMLFALLLFLVVCMVCTTIVTAALTAVTRTHESREWVQRSLALQSAGELLKAEIDGQSYTVKTVTTTGKNGELSTETPVEVMPEGLFAPMLVDVIHAIERNQTALNKKVTITTSQAELSTVTVSVAMHRKGEDSNEYYLIFTLQTEDEDEQMYLTMDINQQPILSEVSTRQEVAEDGTGYTVTVTTKTETYTWSHPKFSRTVGG